MSDPKPTIAFQGMFGAYSHQACVEVFPGADLLPCKSFEGAIAAVTEGRAGLAMLPVENSTYGRVADIHALLPSSGLKIIGEHFVRVHINLMAKPGVALSEIREAHSHTVLLGQCRGFLAEHGIEAKTYFDTGGAAEMISRQDDSGLAALASEVAAETYGLNILAPHIEDNAFNTTRFLVCGLEDHWASQGAGEILTTFVFNVRSIPAALYKALGGFATNGVNMVKLESYMIGSSFSATQFYADVVGHPDDPALSRALEELRYFSTNVEILGVYKSDKPRG